MKRAEIACGVVAYEPDVERLRENLEAVAPQVGSVRVFDNGSRNRPAWEHMAIECGAQQVVLSDENVGMSRALNRLAADARRDGYRAILFLDQDSVAAPDLVERLLDGVEALEAEEVDWGAVASTMVNRKTSHEAPESSSLVLEDRAITSGSLVNLDAWAAVGGYDERLFLDWVDFEFCDALRQAGKAVVRVRDARLLHELGDPVLAFELPIVPPGRQDGAFYAANRPYFRWYDRFRSMAITVDTYAGSVIAQEERHTCRSTVLRALLVEPNRGEVLKAFVRGTRDGRKAVRGTRRATSL